LRQQGSTAAQQLRKQRSIPAGWLRGIFGFKALQNPDSLADAVEKGQVCDFEGFGSIAAGVWEEKTVLSADQMPGQKATEAKAPEGEAWKDDEDLRQRFPRLWEKFLQQGE
jgi:hypothetical protein